MTSRKDRPPVTGDIEKTYPTIADSVGDEFGGEPLTVRLGGLWSDFLRATDEAHDPDAPKRSRSFLPLLDDMKGILHWD